MSKLAVLFAGQGAQKPGMGQSLYRHSAAARQLMDQAEEIMPGILQLCFESEQKELNKTIYTQPCTYVVDMAAYAAFCELEIAPDAGAGFSLGEYAALTAAGVLSFADGLQLVVQRAGWMQQTADEHDGGMMAVLGQEASQVEELVKKVRTDGLLIPVNYNCPGQTVVAGDKKQLKQLRSHCKEQKIRCIPLPISGAFHTEQMRDVSRKISELIDGMTFSPPNFTLYANKTALPYVWEDFKQTLVEQTCRPVLFEQTIRHLIETGFDTFVELGPGKTLSGFVKRIDKSVTILNIEDEESLEQTRKALQ